MSEKAKGNELVSVPDVAIEHGWSYAKAYDAVLRRQFGPPVRVERRLYVQRAAVPTTPRDER
jgi:hypothetical protein